MLRDPVKDAVHPVGGAFRDVGIDHSEQQGERPGAMHLGAEVYVVVGPEESDDGEDSDWPYPGRQLARRALAADEVEGDDSGGEAGREEEDVEALGDAGNGEGQEDGEQP